MNQDTSRTQVDWGTGRYELTAAELEPIAIRAVARAGLRRGERVLDLACGTGNAALLASRTGAAVSGIDAAQRLIEVARAHASAEGIAVSFVVGDMQGLPFDDGQFDVVLSVFGLVFATDVERAFAEMLRVMRPGGRAILTAWIPEGPIAAMLAAFGQAVAAATGSSPPRFAWHDEQTLRELSARHGASATFQEGELVIVGESPEAYFDTGEANHPMSLAARPLLERAGTYAATRARALTALRDGNENTSAFRVRSPYRMIQVHRPV